MPQRDICMCTGFCAILFAISKVRNNPKDPSTEMDK